MKKTLIETCCRIFFDNFVQKNKKIYITDNYRTKSLTKLFSKNLVRYRKENNLTQQDLATILGLSRNYISELENGKRVPSLTTIEKIINKSGISFDYLFNEVVR